MKTYTQKQALDILHKLIFDKYQDRKCRFAEAAEYSTSYINQILSGDVPIPDSVLKMAGLRYSERVIINDKRSKKNGSK